MKASAAKRLWIGVQIVSFMLATSYLALALFVTETARSIWALYAVAMFVLAGFDIVCWRVKVRQRD